MRRRGARAAAVGAPVVRRDPAGPGRFLALGLEFQLAADILLTAVAPSFAQIGQLAAVATIRTALDHFLTREMDRERREVERGSGPGLDRPPHGEQPVEDHDRPTRHPGRHAT